MLNSIKGETREGYMTMFMSSPEARRDFPDDTLRAAAAYGKWRERNNGDGTAWEDLDQAERDIMMKVLSEPAHTKARANAIGQKADTIPMRFIQPGLVRYADVGTVLVRKETLDLMTQSFVGKPVFNETHKEVTSKDFSSGRADGVITRVWFEPLDGWYWADAMVWDPETKENCRNGYSVSCAYDVLRWSDGGGVTNNIPYEREVLDGDYTHMAVVANPRYEGARIIYNTQGGSMKLAFWRKDKDTSEVRNASEVETDNAVLEIDGAKVPLKDAIELWNAAKAEEKKKADELKKSELANAKMDDDDEIEVGGEKVTVKNLKDAYVLSRKNADEKEKEKAEEERKNAEADDKKKAEEEERKNAEAEEAKKKQDDEERKNAEEKERANSFEKVRDAAALRNGKFPEPSLMSREDRVAEGAKRYGAK